MLPSESVIRRMTRLAQQHGAINLAQGFTDEPPPFTLVWAAITALLGMPAAFFGGLARAYAGKRALLGGALRAGGFRAGEPHGAYYLFADYRGVRDIAHLDLMAAAVHLIEHAGVAAVPGDNFYARSADGARYLRFAFCRSLDTLGGAARRLRGLAGPRASAGAVASPERIPR